MQRSTIIAAAVLLFMATPTKAAVVETNTTYFTLRGTSLKAIDRDIARVGPLNPSTRVRTSAATTIDFKPDVRFSTARGSCALVVNGVLVRLDYRQPRWKPSGRPDAITRRVYAALETDIRAFQAEQTQIAKRSARRLESALLRLRPSHDCRTMDARYRQSVMRLLRAHNDQQRRLTSRWAKITDTRLRRAASAAR